MPCNKYDLSDAIMAVSSPASQQRVIIRITGIDCLDNICKRFFAFKDTRTDFVKERKIFTGFITIDDQLEIDAFLYLFPGPHSYTSDDVAEIHLYANSAVVGDLLERLMQSGVRPAEPGEFTARAYLNGRMDLAQAEAVNEIITSSNALQLDASEKILTGNFTVTLEVIRNSVLDCLGLIEAGLDFSGEDITFVTPEQAVSRLDDIKKQLQELLAGSIYYDSVHNLPAVGIAGAPNAGKSSLLNSMLGTERSIISKQRKTTRDVLTGLLELGHCRIVLFDCAGLITEPETVIDELAQQAAVGALQNSSIIIFCVDISKNNWSEDLSVYNLLPQKKHIMTATKSDLLPQQQLKESLVKLNHQFNADFIPVSAKTGWELENLCRQLDMQLLQKSNVSHCRNYEPNQPAATAIIARHRQVLSDAITGLDESLDHIKAGEDEIAAMMLRAAYQNLCSIEQHNVLHVDEQVLDEIFNRFCIGK